MGDTVRLKIILAYQGTDFAGWQMQAPGRGRSVQACLEQALKPLAGTFTRVHGASRTDAGVHALGQVAHCDVPASRADLPWQRALNASLPPDISVVRVERASRHFHARFRAVSKTYTYTLWHERNFLLPQRRPFVWAVGGLDLAAMEEAAREFLGSHDFAAFQNAGSAVPDTIRRVDALDVSPGQTPHETVWTVTGPGFLKQMVRNIIGCLVWVGRGKANAGIVRCLLETGDRTLAPETAPARGLCLERMEFGERERRLEPDGPVGDTPDIRPGHQGLGGPGAPVHPVGRADGLRDDQPGEPEPCGPGGFQPR
jgi:tRNA pseudouridine38-40 synthase